MTTSGHIQIYADDTTIYYISKELEDILKNLTISLQITLEKQVADISAKSTVQSSNSGNHLETFPPLPWRKSITKS